jgi:hypothetical protein
MEPASTSGASSMGAAEARVRAVAELVSQLVAGVRAGRDVDLNALKSEVRGGAGRRAGWAGREDSCGLQLQTCMAETGCAAVAGCNASSPLSATPSHDPPPRRADQPPLPPEPLAQARGDHRGTARGAASALLHRRRRRPARLPREPLVTCRCSPSTSLAAWPNPQEHRTALLPRLRAKPVRTASGIAVVAVMSKPHRCPHIATTGNICIYCPGGADRGRTGGVAGGG